MEIHGHPSSNSTIPNTKIIGISLIRDEDVFIERVLKNVYDFCDKILVADNCSTDKTGEIVKGLAKTNPKIEYHRIQSCSESHQMIEKYAGTNTWVFGLDGDEIYDPAGMLKMREDLLAGKYDGWWVIFGNVLNCVSLDLENMRAEGYLAPPCRSMTKLYNFQAINSWDGPCTQRLHMGTVNFKPGHNASLRLNVCEQMTWDEAYFRCLHTCFIPRSSNDKKDVKDRKNVSELYFMGPMEKLGLGFLKSWFGKNNKSYKEQKYMRGDLFATDVSSFFI